MSGAPGVIVGALKLKIVDGPAVITALVTNGWSKATPRNSGWPVGPDGTKNLPRLVAPLKYSMLELFGVSTSRNTTPNALTPAGVVAVPATLARTKLTVT